MIANKVGVLANWISRLADLEEVLFSDLETRVLRSSEVGTEALTAAGSAIGKRSGAWAATAVASRGIGCSTRHGWCGAGAADRKRAQDSSGFLGLARGTANGVVHLGRGAQLRKDLLTALAFIFVERHRASSSPSALAALFELLQTPEGTRPRYFRPLVASSARLDWGLFHGPNLRRLGPLFAAPFAANTCRCRKQGVPTPQEVR